MRVLLKHQCFFLVFGIILTSVILSASAVPAKDHKKKLLEKLRNALNQTEIEEAGTIELVVETGNIEGLPEAKAAPTPEEEAPEKSEDDDVGLDGEDKKSEDDDKPEATVTDIQKGEGPTSYLLRMKTILKRIFDLFGFRQSKKKEGRQDRMLSGDDSYSINGLEYDYFREDIRTTVGAVLGEKECIQKIVCGAGSYLRAVNGKHVILTILENVTPSDWTDTVEILKKSAVTDGDCTYKCLEDDSHN